MLLDPQLLKPLPFLDGLSDEDREAFALCFQGRGYAPGDTVFDEGDPGASMLLIEQGTLSATSKASGTLLARRFGPGQVIGEASLFDPSPRTVTLRATTPALVFELNEDSLLLVRNTVPAAARALATVSLRSLLRRIRLVEKQLDTEIDRMSMLW
jgi:CRP/FNR family transcriptional regulator, cyclic AMP receptor protein